jgi:hypothetical protein
MANPRVFISYVFVNERHPDYLFAQRLAEDLRLAGADVVIDKTNAGEQAYVQRLNRMLPSCQRLIVVQTPDALQSLRVQMSVNTALQLVTQQRMQKVLAVIATSYETQNIPLTWESLTVFDATQDYARALARILLELDLQDLQADSVDVVLPVADTALLTDDSPVKVPIVMPSAPLPVDAVQSPTDVEDRPLALSSKSNTRRERTPFHKDQDDQSASLPVVPRSKISKSSPERSKGWGAVALIALLLIMITCGVGVLYASRSLPTASSLPFSPTTARVTITPTSSELKNTFYIQAVFKLPDTSMHQVAGRMLSTTTISQKLTVQATGQGKIPATRATGMLGFSETGNAPITIPAGSVYSDSSSLGGSGADFVTDASITVNGTSLVTVPAHAAQVGTIGNIPAGQLHEIQALVHVIAATSFTGGQDVQNFTFVQQGDIDNAANTLEQANTPNPQQVIQPLVHVNERLIGAPQCNPNVSSDHAAGERSTSVTVTVTFTCTGEVYDNDAAMAMAVNLLNTQASKQLGPGFALVDQILTKLTDIASQNTQQRGIVLTIAAQGFWVYQFNDAEEQALLKMLIGKSKQAAEELLLQQRGVRMAEVSITGGNGNNLPIDSRQITLNIVSILHP